MLVEVGRWKQKHSSFLPSLVTTFSRERKWTSSGIQEEGEDGTGHIAASFSFPHAEEEAGKLQWLGERAGTTALFFSFLPASLAPASTRGRSQWAREEEEEEESLHHHYTCESVTGKTILKQDRLPTDIYSKD